CEGLFLHLNRLVERYLPSAVNPFARMGAVANTAFAISLISGILLLFWYSPSVNHAYQSLEALREGSFLGQLMRSLHRYSSDACLLFVVLHAFQTLFARKFAGPRWLAWVSGVFLVGVLWLDGWLGYWLVWDERAKYVALGTAKLLDVLPIFADPLSRSFLTPDMVNSLLFFLVFFLHMLLPLALGIALWIHIMRLHKSVFFTGKRLTLVIALSLIVVSILHPATSAAPADLQRLQADFTIDYFYLFPLYLTQHLEGGVLWLITLIATAVVTAVPWWLPRRKTSVPTVLEERCNGCEQCFNDCPYNAITMIPREGRVALKSFIDPRKCVGCGICVGSCDPAGIIYPALPPLAARRWVNQAVQHSPEEAPAVNVAFVCAESAGGDLAVDADGFSPELPDYRVLPVPCAGWVHPLLVERAIRRGAQRVLIVGCGSDPYCRKGPAWTEERLEGRRKPAFRREKLNGARVGFLQFNRADRKRFLDAARAFARGESPEPSSISRWQKIALAAMLVIGLNTITVAPSDAPFLASASPAPELVVTFQLPGQFVEQPTASTGGQEELLPHMRSPVTLERRRVPVRLRVTVDGKELLRNAYKPGGLFSDGTSIAVERLPIPPGTHTVGIDIGNTPDPEEWNFHAEQVLEFTAGYRHVVRFEKGVGFRWY
ncbi:MAG: hydrogenase iron-sulfur subunit, partial [Calditrichaeota bacterium]